MADEQIPRKNPADMRLYAEAPARTPVSTTELIALALSVLWLLSAGAFFLVTGLSQAATQFDSLRFVMTLLAIFMPVAMIWVATTAMRTSRTMREESARMQAALDAMRQTYLQAQNSSQGIKPAVERKLEEIAAAQRKTESAIATFASIRPAPEVQAVTAPAIEPVPDPDGQGKLALGTPGADLEEPVTVYDFVKALNFPENAEDKEGFRALRRALEDRQIADLVRSSQDVLTMLSQDGIYMDDLRPDRARPEIWRRFAKGERGRAIAGLGGVRDRSCLALTAARMREDAIFRDAGHHFLRRFDKVFAAFEASATDQDIIALSDTRTARAFMLLGRVTGTFT
jgi:type III secretory pathway component EscS